MKKARGRLLLVLLLPLALIALWLAQREQFLFVRGAPPPSEEQADPSLGETARKVRRTLTVRESSLSEQASREAPASLAADRFRWRQTLWGEALTAVQELWGKRQESPDVLHAMEVRDPRWASAMEERLRARFSPPAVNRAGLTGSSLNWVDCRATLCRLQLRYPAHMAETYPGRPPEEDRRHLFFGQSSPIARFVVVNGPLAEVTSIAPSSRTVLPEQHPDGDSRTVEAVLLFSAEEWDPGN
jgi:hypothetical protein